MRRSAPGYQRRTGWRWHFVARRDGLASAFTVAGRAGADVVGRARGTADRLRSLPFAPTLPSTTPPKNFSAVLGTVSAVMLSASPAGLCLRPARLSTLLVRSTAPLYRPCLRGSWLYSRSVFNLLQWRRQLHRPPPQPIQKVNTDAPPQAQVR